VLAQDESGRNYQSVITREQCNDGMSDRQFGFSIRMFLAGKGDGNQVLSGCCTLDHSF
jgi:uncharacterized membrane protein